MATTNATDPQVQLENAKSAVISAVSAYERVKQQQAEIQRSLPKLQQEVEEARRAAGYRVADGSPLEEAVGAVDHAKRRVEAAEAVLSSLSEQERTCELSIRSAVSAFYLARGEAARARLEAHLQRWDAACKRLSKELGLDAEITPADLRSFWPPEAFVWESEVSSSRLAAGENNRNSFAPVLASARAIVGALRQRAA